MICRIRLQNKDGKRKGSKRRAKKKKRKEEDKKKRKKVMKTSRKVSYGAMLVALAMILSYVESVIPINFGVPGMKLGLANLVTVTGLYFLNPGEVFMIVVMRILLVGFMFGNGMSILYSLAGGVLSFVVMVLIKKRNGFSIAGVSIAGGITHNIGQVLVAACVVENLKIVYYLPALLISGTVTGMLIGILGGRILDIVKRSAAASFSQI